MNSRKTDMGVEFRNEDEPPQGAGPGRITRFAWLPIPLLAAAIIIARAAGLSEQYALEGLRLVLSLCFYTLVSLGTLFLVGRNFLKSGSPVLLFLECGVILWCLAGTIGDALARGDANINVTIFNTAILLAGLCHLGGAALWLGPRRGLRAKPLWLGAGYLLALGALYLIARATLTGWFPVFFVSGKGGTLVRQIVLTSSIVIFVISSGLVLASRRRQRALFASWYGMALLLLAVGLFGVLIQLSLGSVVNWLGRSAQWLGGLYLLIASAAALKESNLPLSPAEKGPRPAFYRYGVAAAIVLAATAVRLAFLSALGARFTFVTFFPAVALAALYGGLGPGLLATFLSGLAADYFWIEPLGKLAIANPSDWIGLVFFAVSCVMMCVIIEAMHKARARLVFQQDHLEELVKNRTGELEREIAERKKAESRLESDLAALTKIHRLSARPVAGGQIVPLLQEIMDAAVFVADAQKGTLQLLESDSLRIVAHHGHEQPFLDFFASAENRASVCGEATRRGERVVVPDVETNLLFAGTPSLDILRRAGVRAVQSTPIITRSGELLGILTTQWDAPREPDERDLWRIDLLARQAADLIESDRASEYLRRSERRERERAAELAAILDAAPTPVFIAHDPDCLHITGNRAADDLLRNPRGGEASLSAADEHKPSHFRAFKDGRELRTGELPAQRAARGADVRDFEFTLVFDDGATREVAGYATPLRDAGGAPRGAVLVLVDITERKEAEESLRTTLQRLYTILSGMYIAVVLATEEDRVEFVNQAFCDYFDSCETPADFVGLHSSDLISKIKDAYVHPDDAVARLKEIIAEGRPVRGEEVAMRNGRMHLRDFMPIRIDGKPYGRLWYHADITERKAAEDALRRSRDELDLRVRERTLKLQMSEETALRQKVEIESYYHTAPIGLCVLDTRLRFVRINEHLAQIDGLPASEHIGRTVREIVPVLADKIEGVARQVLETGEPVINVEVAGETPAQPGVRRTWMAAWYPLRDAEARTVGISVVVQEVTEQRKLEEQLRQSQKMEAISTLAGGIAHDFNNILAAILGFTEMAIDDVEDRPLVSRNLHNVMKSAMRARELVKQILAFSRKASYERSPLALTPVIKETVQLLRASIPKTVDIRLSVRAGSDTVLASPVEIQQILMNLATNASLAMQETGGIMEISLTDIDFEPDLMDSASAEYVKITVKDTGCGMSPEVVKRIFEPFYTTREVGKGSGMGLAVVYGIVKDLQGTITVESEEGTGSTFRVFLPKAEAGVKAEGAKPSEIVGGRERILFVDDEEMLVEWGKATLERLGYRVAAVTDSKEALKTFSADPMGFDLVITDHAMPQMAGAEFSKEVLKMRSDIPIILCTGHSEIISPEKAREIGIREFLMKPLARKELAEAVRRLLDARPAA